MSRRSATTTPASRARPTSCAWRSIAPSQPCGTVVIGVGNALRRDDAAGLEVARRVRRAAPPGVAVLEHEGDAAALLEAWRGAACVVVVDAVTGGAGPGTVRRIDAGAAPVSRAPGGASTHGAGVAEAIELGRALGRLPGRLVLVCVEGDDFGTGAGLSPRVERALDAAVAAVLAEVDSRA